MGLFRRAVIMALCAAASLTSVAARAQGALGANYNEHYEDVDYRDLEKSGARWVRLFLPMPQLDGGRAADHGAVRTILDAGDRGYRTILTLKFAYIGVPFPKVGSEAYARDIARLDTVLPLVMGKVDMLVIGNEPYNESRRVDHDDNLNAYYEALAKRAIAYRARTCPDACRTRLYMGALNRLDLDRNRNRSTERWLAFVKASPEIDGVTIHPHIPTFEASRAFLDFILPRIRPEQTFIVTEFSLVRRWQQHLKEVAPTAFTVRHGFSADTRNWQVIRDALERPFDKAAWDDFLSHSPWFESQKHYLRDQMAMFRATGHLAVATYGFRQGASMTGNFGPKSTPWLLNSVFAARTVKPNADGSAAFNYAWIDDFRALQEQ